ncbi:MAG TPA: tetratricopeptide repeat protein, partial [Chitinispirillaceae bacterium]|nr:tetratricopeptide repeat protein [Chitinispirillaceae bacterium]
MKRKFKKNDRITLTKSRLSAVRTGIKVLILCMVVLVLQSCSSNSSAIQKGEMSLRLGDYTMAIDFFEEVLHRSPDNYDARVGLGKALIQQAVKQHGDTLLWSKALVNLEAARTLMPQSDIEPLLSDAWMARARIDLDNRDTLAALTALSRTLELTPGSIAALNAAGIIYFKMGDADKSLQLLNRAALIDTTAAFTFFNAGMVKWSMKDYGGAHKAWFKAVALAPQDKDIVFW